jgi:hypothetical protein
MSIATKSKVADRKTCAAMIFGAAAAAATIGFAGVANAAPTPEPGAHGTGGMFGDPVAAAAYWQHQNDTDCGEMAVADVVGQTTGTLISEAEITSLAENTPSIVQPGMIWHSGAFTKNRDLRVLLASYGISADDGSRSFEDLQQALGNGQKVIVGLNDRIIWNTPGDRTKQNHFVVVTGIDTGSGVVHMNDSGIRHGADEQVSVADFAQAWATSDNFAVITAR